MPLRFAKKDTEMRIEALMWVLLLFLTPGCAIGQGPLGHPEVVERRCGPVSTVQRSVDQSPPRVHADTEIPPGNPDVLAGRFSQQSQRIADRIGVKHLLVQEAVLEGKTDRDIATAVERLQVQQQVSNRIALALLDVARTAAEAASDKLAEDIVAFDVSEQLVITDVFVLCSAKNDRQVKSIVDEIEDKLREIGAKPVRREGERDGRWVLIDYGEIVVHVQHEEERQFYALERLWRDCPTIELPADVVSHER